MRIISFVVVVLLAFPDFLCAIEPIKIKIGVSVPLSGPLAFVGNDIRRGFLLGQEEFSTDHLQFEILYQDDQYRQNQAVSVARKFFEFDKVDLIVSLWDMAEVIAPLAERYQVPHISIRWNPHIAEKFSYTLTMESTYKSWVNSLVDLLMSLNLSKVGLLTEEAQGWILASDYLHQIVAAGTAGNLAIVGEERLLGSDLDNRSAVTRLLNKEPEIVLVLSNPPFTQRLIRWVREIKNTQRYTGYLDLVEETELTNGIPFIAQFDIAEWFNERFKKRFGSPVLARAPHSYDIVKLISLIQSKSAKPVLGANLVKALTNVHNVGGATGVLDAKGTRTIESECVWKIVGNGTIRRLVERDLMQLRTDWPLKLKASPQIP